MENNESNNARNNKTSLSDNNTPAVTDKNSELEDSTFVPVGECPEGMILNEETGECKSNVDTNKKIKKVSVIDILQADYKNVLRGYQEYPSYDPKSSRGSVDKERPLRNSINGYDLYYKILSYIPEKELTFSIGYLDDNKNWTEHKRFASTVSGSSLTGYRYKGKFLKLDNPDYYCTKNANLIVGTNPLSIELDGLFQCNDGEGEYRISGNAEVGVIILNSEKEQPINEIITTETKNEYNIYAYPYMEVPILKNPTTSDTSVRYAWGDVRKTIDGFPSYYRILSYKKEGYNKELTISFGYINNDEWVEYKQFKTLGDDSEECVKFRKDSGLVRKGLAGEYCGKIFQTDNYSYECLTNALDLFTEPPRLNLS